METLTRTAPVRPRLPQKRALETPFQAAPAEIRYAQCWEDADVLLAALAVQPGDRCLSIASAGDNALALLTRHPESVVALDMNPAQLACLALRVAAYRRLQHGELLELVGSRPSARRWHLYLHCRPALDAATQAFWDARPHTVAAGIGAAGKFERYFRVFRERVLPLAQSPQRVARLLRGGSPDERTYFHDAHWDNWRWRMLFRVFFSRFVMSRLGRDPHCFRYADAPLAQALVGRARHACTALDPAQNPYLQWILTGEHRTALPLALRPEHFETIRANLDRLTWHCTSLEAFLAEQPRHSFDRFNLSDVFEYVSEAQYHRVLRQLVRVGRKRGRLAYWNLLVPRQRPGILAPHLTPLTDLAADLHARDNAFFYQRLVVEELL